MSDARGRRERLYHPPGGHTSTDLDILSEPAARALAIAQIKAEAEEARRVAELAEAEAQWWAGLIAAAEAEDQHREAVELARARRTARITKKELEQQTEPRLVPPPPKLRTIAKAVADYYRVSILDLASKRRTANILIPRQVFCYLARKHTFQSFPQIGEHLGGRDHTTILHAFNKIAILMSTDAQLAADIAAIRRTLEGS